jgi:hypothetical protein
MEGVAGPADSRKFMIVDDPWWRMIYYLKCVSVTHKDFEAGVPRRFREGTWTTPPVSEQASVDIIDALQLMERYSPESMCRSGFWLKSEEAEISAVGSKFFVIPASPAECERNISRLSAASRLQRARGTEALQVLAFSENWARLNHAAVVRELRALLAARGLAL